MTDTKDTPKLLFSAKTNEILWKIKLNNETLKMSLNIRLHTNSNLLRDAHQGNNFFLRLNYHHI